MKIDSIINTLYEIQLDKEINRQLLSNHQYKKADKYAEKKLRQLMKTNLTKKQFHRLDDLVAAYNNTAIEFARIAYFQGMADGLQLLHELENKR